MSKQAIHQYYNRLDQYKRYGGTRNESSIRRAFANLLEEYCLPKHLVLVDELHLKGSQMDLHLNYETIEPYPLKRQDELIPKENPKPKLRVIPENGTIILDENTTLLGVPEIAWNYTLGNRSALHWILDQYKEKKPKDPTIAEKFNTYTFADYKDHVIDLLTRVCTVSVKTMEIIREMEASQEPD